MNGTLNEKQEEAIAAIDQKHDPSRSLFQTVDKFEEKLVCLQFFLKKSSWLKQNPCLSRRLSSHKPPRRKRSWGPRLASCSAGVLQISSILIGFSPHIVNNKNYGVNQVSF